MDEHIKQCLDFKGCLLLTQLGLDPEHRFEVGFKGLTRVDGCQTCAKVFRDFIMCGLYYHVLTVDTLKTGGWRIFVVVEDTLMMIILIGRGRRYMLLVHLFGLSGLIFCIIAFGHAIVWRLISEFVGSLFVGGLVLAWPVWH